jgi:oligopeptide transport system permease protein
MTDAAAPAAGRLGPALARFRGQTAAMGGLIAMVLILAACVLGPLVIPHDAETSDFAAILMPPDLASGHWLGTDDLGRDVLARVLEGGQISLLIGAFATVVSVVIGVAWGAVAGYAGGRVDTLMMRIVDVLYALPFVFFVILLTVMFGRSLFVIFLAVGLVNWLTIAVIVRGQTLGLKRRPFVEAARIGGMTGGRIVRRHIVPNTMGAVIVYASLTVPEVILGESFLSFLGLGVQEPRTSWGVLIEQGAAKMESAPWLLLSPGLMLAATLFALNFIADGLRDAFDPRSG